MFRRGQYLNFDSGLSVASNDRTAHNTAVSVKLMRIYTTFVDNKLEEFRTKRHINWILVIVDTSKSECDVRTH